MKPRKSFRAVFSTVLCVGLASFVFSQDENSGASNGEMEKLQEKVSDLNGQLKGLEESYLETMGTVAKLNKIKVSGYVQAQYRMLMDSAGIMDATGKYAAPAGDFSGGKFSDGTRGLLHVRRGRFKIAYDNGLAQSAVQLDATEKGVGIKDAYLSFTDPWIKSVSLKTGLFDRPFGFEISYSSSSRESPERSRLFQTLFPGERDVGAQLQIAPNERMGMVSYLNLKGGLFNGVGIGVENDDHKDFIGRLGMAIPLTDINLAVDAGVSAYIGTVTNTDTTHASVVRNAANTADSIVNTRGYSYEMIAKAFKKSDDEGMLNKTYERQYLGGDIQIYYDVPVIGGFSFRGEYIQGKQPGTSSSSGFYNPGRNSTSGVYMRNFMGYYFMYVQNLGLKNQLIVKYDSYDPNTDVEGKDIGNTATTKLSTADLQYSTLGLGLVHYWDENVKVVAYYDMVSNEKAGFTAADGKEKYNDDLNDDVLTVRIQYKF